MHKDIGRPLFFILLALLYVGSLGTMMFPYLMPLYLILVIVGVPILILTGLNKLLTPRNTTTISTESIPGQKRKSALVMIIVVTIIYLFLLGI